MGLSFPIRPTFPIDVRPEPGSAITVRREGTAILIGGGAGAGNGGVPLGLFGGSAGQVLTKASDRSLDFTWTTPTASGAFVYLDLYKVANQTTWDAALANAVKDLPYGGRVYLLSKGQTYSFTTLTLPQDVVLMGCYEQMPLPGTNQLLNLNGLQWVRIKAGGTVTLNAGAGIACCAIAPDGMTFPQPNSNNWVGTAITIVGDQTLVRNCLVIGFGTTYSSDGRQRGVVENLFFDSNNGLYLKNIYDTTRMFGLHGWPFATIQAYSSSTGSDPAGRDASINYRTGSGMTFVSDVDDLYVDSAIMVGFKVGYDFQKALGAHIGRAWSECYGLPGTYGFKFGPDCDNIFIEDAQVWHCDGPVYVGMADGSGNRVSFGHIRSVNPNYHGMQVAGGNVSFGILEVRGTKEGNAALNITGTQSMVEGTVIDEGGANNTPSVFVANPFTSEKIELLKVRAPYKTLGVSKFGANPIYAPYTNLSGTTLPLPPDGNFFKVRAGGTIATINAAYGTREITLLFVGATTVQFGTGNIAGPGSGFASTAGGVAKFYFDAEYNSWRFMSYADTTVGALAGGSSSTPSTAPATTLYGNTTGAAAAPSFSSLSAFLDTIVSSTGAMIARGPSSWGSTGIGSAGQVLTSSGNAGLPYWASPAASVQDVRLLYVNDIGGNTIYSNGNTGAGTIYEPYVGAVVTGLSANSSGVIYGARWRYLQKQVAGSWYTVGAPNS